MSNNILPPLYRMSDFTTPHVIDTEEGRFHWSVPYNDLGEPLGRSLIDRMRPLQDSYNSLMNDIERSLMQSYDGADMWSPSGSTTDTLSRGLYAQMREAGNTQTYEPLTRERLEEVFNDLSNRPERRVHIQTNEAGEQLFGEALLRDVFPQLTPEEILERFDAISADPISALGRAYSELPSQPYTDLPPDLIQELSNTTKDNSSTTIRVVEGTNIADLIREQYGYSIQGT